jgi:hypothetical protein
MNAQYRIDVSSEPQGAGGRATFIVEKDEGGLRLDEVRIETGASGVEIPEILGELDFRGCISMALTLLRAGSAAPREPLSGQEAPLPPTQEAAQETVADRIPTPRQAAKKTKRPDSGAPSDLARVYWRVGGSIAKVAKHYEVPRQIAGDWVKDLRDDNLIPS